MNPLKIQNSEKFVDFIDSFETELRENWFQREIKSAYDQYLSAEDGSRGNSDLSIGIGKLIPLIGVVSKKVFQAVGDLKLRLIAPNSDSYDLILKRKWMHEKGKLLFEDCDTISFILKELQVVKDPSPAENQLAASLKGLYIKRMKEFSKMIDEPLLEERELFDLVCSSFGDCQPHLERILKHYLDILEIEQKLEPLDVDLNYKSPKDPTLFPLAKFRSALTSQLLQLDHENRSLLETLKKKVLKAPKQEERLFSLSEKRSIDYLKDVQERFFAITCQGLEDEKIRKHREIRVITKDIHRSVQREFKGSTPKWALTPWGKVLCEKASGPQLTLFQSLKEKYNTAATHAELVKSLFSNNPGENGTQFLEKITSLKELKRNSKQQLETLRREYINIDNANAEATKEKIVSLEKVEKQLSMTIYQKFLNRLIDLTCSSRLKVRKLQEELSNREDAIDSYKMFQQYVQKLLKIEAGLPEKIKDLYTKEKSSDYIAMLASKIEANYEPSFNQKVMVALEKYGQPLCMIPSFLEGEIQKLQHQNEIDLLTIESCNFRVKVLNNAFEATIIKYQNSYNSTQHIDVFTAFGKWLTDTLAYTLSFGYWKMANAAPSEYFRRKDLADLGYDMMFDCKKLLEKLVDRPGETWKDVIGAELNDFITWASNHPIAAASIASNLTQLMHTVYTNKDILNQFVSRLKANVFMSAVLGALGRPIKEMPDHENELRFRALADLVQYLPVWTRGAQTIGGLFKDYRKGSTLFDTLVNFGERALLGVVDRGMHDMIANLPTEMAVVGLQIARVIANVVHGQAYMDSVAERQKVEFINNTSQNAQMFLRPSTLKNKLVQWSQILSAAKGKEKLLRLISTLGIIGGGASLAAPSVYLLIGLLGPFGILPAIAASAGILFYSFKKALQVNELLDDVFPNTFETVRRQEASNLFDEKENQMNKLMKKNIEDLQRRGILPNQVDCPENLQAWAHHPAVQELCKAQQVEFDKKLSLAETIEVNNKKPATMLEHFLNTEKTLVLKPNDYLSIFNNQLLKPDYKTELQEKIKEVLRSEGIETRLTVNEMSNLATSLLNENILLAANSWLKRKLLCSYKEHFIENYVGYKASPYRPNYHLATDDDDPDVLLENMLCDEIAKLNGNLAVNQDQRILRLVLQAYVAKPNKS